MKNIVNKIAIFLLSLTLIGTSCQKSIEEFFKQQFPEPNNLSTDLAIDGEIAAPILNTSLSLVNFIPTNLDSSLWIQVDNEKIIHLRMYFKEFFTINASQIFGCPVPGTIPADSFSFSSDTNKLKIYDNVLEGHVYFNDPRFKIILYNRIPIITFLKVDTLRFHSEAYSTVYKTPFQKIYINRPFTPTETAKTEILIDKQKLPGLELTFSPVPKFISFRITTGTDIPQTFNTSQFPDICDRKITGDLDIDLPLNIRIDNLTLADTSAFPELKDNIEQIDSVKIKLFIDNDIPIGGKVNLSLTDTNAQGQVNNIIMKILEDWNFASSQTNNQGFTVTSGKSVLIYKFSQADLKKIKDNNASKFILSIKLDSYNTAQLQQAKILSNYKIKVKMGIKISYKGNTNQI